jgi:DNA-binding FrmR family transcriptional regulator
VKAVLTLKSGKKVEDVMAQIKAVEELSNVAGGLDNLKNVLEVIQTLAAIK